MILRAEAAFEPPSHQGHQRTDQGPSLMWGPGGGRGPRGPGQSRRPGLAL
jgi:hypothetical protein